jgi:hypothetical protein
VPDLKNLRNITICGSNKQRNATSWPILVNWVQIGVSDNVINCASVGFGLLGDFDWRGVELEINHFLWAT